MCDGVQVWRCGHHSPCLVGLCRHLNDLTHGTLALDQLLQWRSTLLSSRYSLGRRGWASCLDQEQLTYPLQLLVYALKDTFLLSKMINHHTQLGVCRQSTVEMHQRLRQEKEEIDI